MTLCDKMNAVIAEVNSRMAEREEVVHGIALALLTGKNMFILGEPGQAKSYAINRFRKRIIGARQYKRLMTKEADEEQIFGRLDLGSLIPGNLPQSVLKQNDTYSSMQGRLDLLMQSYEAYPEPATTEQIKNLTDDMDWFKTALAHLHGNTPCIITDNKLTDCHIGFLDEIFKSSDGVLNALLEILNERTWTNEGVSMKTPVISIFAASNEIPNLSDPAEKILAALYDRLELKYVTAYIQDRNARLETLHNKQASDGEDEPVDTITLEELYEMQREVKAVSVDDDINRLMDDILLDLRGKGVAVSDRKYFEYTPIVQAQAWLDGRSGVDPADLFILKHYLWTAVEDIPTVEQTLREQCENPIDQQVLALRSRAYDAKRNFDTQLTEPNAKAASLIAVLQTNLIPVYNDAVELRETQQRDADRVRLDGLIAELEGIYREASNTVSFNLPTLEQQAALDSERRNAA